MRVATFNYHDVVKRDARAGTGFVGPGPDRYKVDPAAFEQHLRELAAVGAAPRRVHDAGDGDILLTFDDGGVAAAATTAPMLEAHGWIGHFFVTTDRVGERGFVTAEQLRSLRAHGHVVGSHARTHRPLTRLSDEDVRAEWEDSRRTLEEILGESVDTASVPGGFYDARVARLAEEAGYVHLFTSEPWPEPRTHGRARIYGRFSVVDGTPASRVRALARLERGAVARERVSWTARKMAKALLGDRYARLRRALLARRAS